MERKTVVRPGLRGVAAALLLATLPASAAYHVDVASAVSQAHGELVGRLLSPEGLLWDYVGELPTPTDCAEGRPNALGWWSPIENGPMFTGPWLGAMCRKARITRSAEDAALCRKLAEGLLLAASVSDTPGMVVRGVGTDGRCHYPLGSTDQTVPWFFGLHAYWASGLADAEMKARVAAKMLEVGTAVEAFGWKIPSDGVFTGQSRGNLVADSMPFRGAAHYLFVLRALYDVTGDSAWYGKYLTARDSAPAGQSLTRLAACESGYLIDKKTTNFDCDGSGIWIYVCAQGCLRTLWEEEQDPAVKARYRTGLDATAASASAKMSASASWKNTVESPFRYANWRTGYTWREQMTQADAEAVSRTGISTVLGTRKSLERTQVSLPLAAAAICGFAGAASDTIAATLRVYDYSTVNISEFFAAEVAYWAGQPLPAADGPALPTPPLPAALGRARDWFDADVAHCVLWPADAAIARGGSWNAGVRALADVAAVETPGVLKIAADTGLSFVADEAKTPGRDGVRSVLVDADVDLQMFSPDALPAVDSSWKGGVLVACDGETSDYFGLAEVDGANAWVVLHGPSVRLGGSVHLRLALVSRGGTTFARYTIDGVDCSWNGCVDIPIVVPGTVSSVVCRGEGRLTSLAGSVGRSSGIVLTLE